MNTPDNDVPGLGEPRNPGPFNDRRLNAEASIKDAAVEAASSVSELYQVSHSYLERQATERPYVVLGAALGVGFILGGGLASRLAGVLLTAGGKLLAAELLQRSSAHDTNRPEFIDA